MNSPPDAILGGLIYSVDISLISLINQPEDFQAAAYLVHVQLCLLLLLYCSITAHY